MTMPRSPAQSDFVIEQRDELPEARVHSTQASARATRWVMTLTFVMLAAFVLLCLIGPHIPSGE